VRLLQVATAAGSRNSGSAASAQCSATARSTSITFALGGPCLVHLALSILDAITIVRPETVLRWHRMGFAAEMLASRKLSSDITQAWHGLVNRRNLPATNRYCRHVRKHPWPRSWHEARAAYPQHRSSNANSLCGQNSAGSRESERPFKGIFCDDVSEFESYHLSQPVRSPPSFTAGPLKSPRIGPIPRIGFSLRVPDRAANGSSRRSVSEGYFWYLVFPVMGRSLIMRVGLLSEALLAKSAKLPSRRFPIRQPKGGSLL
jgi:hypothetical protein